MNKLVFPNDIMLGEVSKMLSEGHDVIIMTKGGSMRPFIRGDHDSVRLRKCADVAVGDMVLAQIAPGTYVLHTVRAINGEDVILKGDGNLRGIERCRVGDICGTVMAIVSPSGKEKDVFSPRFVVRARRWRNSPYQFRRIVLGVLRRIRK